MTSSALLLAVKDIGHQLQDIELRENFKKVESLENLPPILNQLDEIDIKSQQKNQVSSSKHDTIFIHCQRCGYSHQVTLKCKNWRLCNFCRIRELLRLKRRYLKVVESIPVARLRLITLTLKNTPELDKGKIKALRDFWVKLMRQEYYSKKVVGGLYTIEVIYGRNGWHPHIHALVEVKDGRYLPGSNKLEKEKHTLSEERLSEDWRKLTGDSFIVNILPVYPSKKHSGGVAGLNYILKYLSKTPYLSGEYSTYLTALNGSRLLSPFGEWWGRKDRKVVTFSFICPNCGHSKWVIETDTMNITLEELYCRSP